MIMAISIGMDTLFTQVGLEIASIWRGTLIPPGLDDCVHRLLKERLLGIKGKGRVLKDHDYLLGGLHKDRIVVRVPALDDPLSCLICSCSGNAAGNRVQVVAEVIFGEDLNDRWNQYWLNSK